VSVRIAKIALSAATYSIDKPYDYRIPPELSQQVCPGVRVIVPFAAGNRRTEGVVLSVGEEPSPSARLKTVLAVLDASPVLDGPALQLALWMRERYFCTVYDAARAMLPAGLWFTLKDIYAIAPGVGREQAYEVAAQSELARRTLDFLFASGGSAALEQIRAVLHPQEPLPVLKRLASRGILAVEHDAKRQVGDKSQLVASLAIPAEEALAQVTPKRGRAPLRYAVVELLCGVGRAAAKEICYFTGASLSTLRSLEKSGILTLSQQEVLRRVLPDQIEPAGPVSLNPQQQEAYSGLESLLLEERPEAALLYGVTGSGKTQVYLKLIRRTLDLGRTAMLLVPEIALTPQLVHIFASHFGENIAVLHSSLKAGERYDEWKRIRSGRAQVVIGTRSAVFAPLENLGLVILDEEQEGTYKSEQAPRYHAREIAKYRCAQENALLLLGSATPSVETMYQARQGHYHLFTLTQRYNQRELPQVTVVDMKEELKSGNGSSISTPLRLALEENLHRGEQSILFLNRRGASRMVSCGECGEVPTCPRCSVYLTYHSANGRLMCHHCGHSERLPQSCPTCGGELQFIGVGTQKLQTELEALFPGTEVLRMDTDTITATRTHEMMLERFVRKKVPILVGTQMVAKGLDFENVTLVGVVAADLSLYVDHYQAAERTFSLLTQVVGRAGRGSKTGRAVIQTWTPEHEVIRFASSQDYDSFYEAELQMRRLRGVPPFSDLFFITASGLNEESVLRVCMRLRDTLNQWLSMEPVGEKPTVLGPAPASVAKVNNRYRYRLTVNCANTKQIRGMVAHLIRVAQSDPNNRGVSIFADVNPLD
jgi:primosomal protein N' (replication factor Y)